MSKKRPEVFHDETGAGGFIACIPRQIEAASNPQYAHLSGFPANLVYTTLDPPRVPNGLPRVRGACYWPDAGSYHEDAHVRSVRYVPRVENPYSVLVVHAKTTSAWTVHKYRGTTITWSAHGADFRNAMMHATMVGVASDEPTDDLDDQVDS